MPSQLGRDGSVTFSDGQHVPHVDTVMYCTGYLYTFPFLDNIVSTADNRFVAAHLCPSPVSLSCSCNLGYSFGDDRLNVQSNTQRKSS